MAIAHVCQPSLNCCKKIVNAKLSRIILHAVQIPFTGTKGPTTVPVWQCL